MWKKKNFDVTFGLDKKVSELKEHIQRLTCEYVIMFMCECMFVTVFTSFVCTAIPPAMMKLMYKGESRVA